MKKLPAHQLTELKGERRFRKDGSDTLDPVITGVPCFFCGHRVAKDKVKEEKHTKDGITIEVFTCGNASGNH